MTAGLVLVAAILVLGGVIATVGDRLGMRVGKARLTLFNLRPRQTATLITILTGSVISASTFAILFAVSDQLRTGVFELENIQEDLADARTELDAIAQDKQDIEEELTKSQREQVAAQRRLEEINRSLQTAIERQAETQAQLDQRQAQVQQIQAQYQQAQRALQEASQQAAALQSEIQTLQSERQSLIEQQQAVQEQIAERDQEIAERDRAIALREAELKTLEDQYIFLSREIQDLAIQKQELEQELLALRQGNVALLRNQRLAAGVVRVVTPTAAPQAIEQLLVQANQVAVQRVLPGTIDLEEQIIQITTAEVEEAIKQIEDGQDYVIRVQADGNYVEAEPCVLAGEACIKVYLSVAQNQLVFQRGEVIATAMIDPANMTDQELAERLLVTIAAAQFRARQAGIFADSIQITDNRRETAIEFLRNVRTYGQPLEIQVIAAEDAYTAQARLELIAVSNGQILFGTQSQSDTGNDAGGNADNDTF